MKRRTASTIGFLCLELAIIMALSSCGAATNAGGPARPSISVSPASASVQAGLSIQFTATVQFDGSNPVVGWRISRDGDLTLANCVGSDCGSIDSTGKYTASSTVTASLKLQIVAETGTLDAEAALLVVPAPTAAVSISPTTTSVQAGRTTQFTATVQNDPSNKGVAWSISTTSGVSCSRSDCGSIDSTGNYTAPEILPNISTIIVTARSQADTSASSKATVNLGSDADNAKLVGQYAFLANGVNADGPFSMAGSVTADGNGRITNGIGDLILSSSIHAELGASLIGTYSVAPDNRGSITLTATLPSGSFSQSFSFALTSFIGAVAGRGRLAENVGDQFWSSGVLAKQDPTEFSSDAIAGSWIFTLNGADTSGTASASIGRFTAANGSLTAGQTDVLASAPALSGPNATLKRTYAPNLSFVGVYDVTASGQGSVTFNFTGQNPGFSNFSFYVVSSTELFVIQIDQCATNEACSFKRGLTGTAIQASSASFSASSLTGQAAHP